MERAEFSGWWSFQVCRDPVNKDPTIHSSGMDIGSVFSGTQLQSQALQKAEVIDARGETSSLNPK